MIAAPGGGASSRWPTTFRFRSLFGRLMSLYVLIVIGTLGLLGLLLSCLLQDYFFTTALDLILALRAE